MTFTVCRKKLIAYAFMGAGAIFYAGWICSLSYFNVSERWHSERTLAVVQNQVVPNLKAKAKAATDACNNNAVVATDAIVTADNYRDLPSIGDIADCPKAAVSAPVRK